MTSVLVEELARYIAKRQAIIIAGAGVTITATSDPVNYSWQGLLRSGLKRCAELRQNVDPVWIAEVERKILSTNTDELIAAAQEIQNFLQAGPGKHFHKWLRDAVGSPKVVSPGLLHAIAELNVPVATTNYDSLLSSYVGGSAKTWLDPSAIQRLTRGEEKGIIHIHGHWDEPSSIVLGVKSYGEAMGDSSSQQIVRALFASHSVIFVGFGSGLDDPNFLGLRAWAREVLADSEFPPTILVRNSEVRDAEARYNPDGFQVIPYGETFDELELFLTDLRPTASTKESAVAYDWPMIQIKLTRLNRRIRREWDPELVIAMSGPGNFAPYYCMSLDTNETPTVSAITFPKTSGRSPRNYWFARAADISKWKHIESTKWDVFLPEILSHFPKATRMLIFDDRVIGGNVQRRVAAWLTDEFGYEVRRAAIVVHPDIKDAVDWYEDVLDGEFNFPWGGKRGRS